MVYIQLFQNKDYNYLRLRSNCLYFSIREKKITFESENLKIKRFEE